MPELLDNFVNRFLYASFFICVTGMIAAIALRSLRIRSPRIHSACGWMVLLQGVLLFHVYLPLPLESREAIKSNMFSELLRIEPMNRPSIESMSPMSSSTDHMETANPPPMNSLKVQNRIRISHLLIVIWCAGFMFLVGRWLQDYFRLVKYFQLSSPANSEWQDQWIRMLDRYKIKRRIPLQTSSGFGPALCFLPSGYQVMVPFQMWSNLSEAQRESILRHELAHLQRNDIWLSLIANMLAMLHWFNPVAWFAVSRIELASEWASDDSVRALNPKLIPQYARAILGISQQAVAGRSATTAAYGNCVAVRIRRMLAQTLKEESMCKKIAVLMPMILLACAGVFRFEVSAQIIAQDKASQDAVAEPAALQDPNLIAQDANRSKPILDIDRILSLVHETVTTRQAHSKEISTLLFSDDRSPVAERVLDKIGGWQGILDSSRTIGTIDSWLEDKNANVYNFKVDYEQLTKEIEIVFDALVGRNSWAGILESIANDTHGPKINLRRDVVDNLGNQIKLFAYDADLLTSQAQRVLFAVAIKDAKEFEQTLGKFMSSEPNIQRTQHLGITIFFASDKRRNGKKNEVPIPWGCCVANGHLLAGERALVMAALDRGFAKK